MQCIHSDIQTICTGTAASMASVLLVAGTKGKRKMLPNAKVLIHQPSGLSTGTAADMTIDINEMNKEKEKLYNILAKHTGKTALEISCDSQRDFWLDAEAALKYGCVDEIVNPRK
jgi:ATP-dependent Clp protease protease subunit